MTRFFIALSIAAAIAGDATAQTMMGSPAQVVGSVGGQPITLGELEDHWREIDLAGHDRTREQLYESLRAVLDDLIGDRLIALEAKKRGMTVADLLERELPRRAPEVTEAGIRQFYDQNRDRFSGRSFDEMKPAITNYLAQQRPVLARRSFIDDLKKASPDIAIVLDPPRRSIPVGPSDPVTGPPSAPVEIVEYSDFQCPFCKKVAPIIKSLRSTFGDQVRVVYKDFPLTIHAQAREAAEAAQCAQAQNKFWEYHDVLFGHQDALKKDDLKRYARDLGLDAADFNRCVDERRFESRVRADLDEAERFGLSATPVVFINGRTVMGAAPGEVYETIVREELARAKQNAGK